MAVQVLQIAKPGFRVFDLGFSKYRWLGSEVAQSLLRFEAKINSLDADVDQAPALLWGCSAAWAHTVLWQIL